MVTKVREKKHTKKKNIQNSCRLTHILMMKKTKQILVDVNLKTPNPEKEE